MTAATPSMLWTHHFVTHRCAAELSAFTTPFFVVSTPLHHAWQPKHVPHVAPSKLCELPSSANRNDRQQSLHRQSSLQVTKICSLLGSICVVRSAAPPLCLGLLAARSNSACHTCSTVSKSSKDRPRHTVGVRVTSQFAFRATRTS